MATEKQIDREAILSTQFSEAGTSAQLEQAYRNAFVDGFDHTVAILQRMSKALGNIDGQAEVVVLGGMSTAVLETTLVMLAEYKTRLQMWQIGNTDKDVPPPDFFSSK